MRTYREGKDATLSAFIAEERGNLVHVCHGIFYSLAQQNQENIPFLVRKKPGSESTLQNQNTQGPICAANNLSFFPTWIK